MNSKSFLVAPKFAIISLFGLAVGAALLLPDQFLLLKGLILVISALIGVSGWISVERRSQQLAALSRLTQRMESFDRENILDAASPGEISNLALQVNKYAEQIHGQLDETSRRCYNYESLLASMREGVLAFDQEASLIYINSAAQIMLELDQSKALGRSLEEVLRNNSMQRFAHRAICTRESAEADITMYASGENIVRVYARPLYGKDSQHLGVMIVFSDITHWSKLENIRKDFVANVSHELRTPITSIKGFVETLLDGAAESPENRSRFLGIISRQVDRLNNIIEDLLQLSRLEQDQSDVIIRRDWSSIYKLVQSAMLSCEQRAQRKGVRLTFECSSKLHADVNASLLEQAVVNLIENAVQYTDVNGLVHVKALTVRDQLRISVQDTGCGIDAKHVARIFERFYRVDKARSRSAGGTGLGLAIVKHITQAHGGFPTVDSVLGKGSVFTLHLPVRAISEKPQDSVEPLSVNAG